MTHVASILLGIDIGGSFTDIVAADQRTGRLVYAKTPTYNTDLVRSLREALEAVGAPRSEIGVIRHGTTVVINAILTRSGGKTGLVTTEGFRDVLEIGRTNWPEPYNLFFDRMPPLVPRERRFEVGERLAADGSTVRPVDLEDLNRVADRLRAEGVDAVAVCLLHSYANPEHEKLIGAALAEALPDAYVSLSHELSREFREYERTSTVVANAFVGGVVDEYLAKLEAYLADGGYEGSLYLMESNGGVTTAASARRRPIALVESGPAAGVMATAEISRSTAVRRAIAFDMGGTTAKACLVEDGVPLITNEYFVPTYERGYPIRVAAVDILEVGTGGGSLARVDAVGMLTVGPESAGAVPGPACFAAGGVEPTVTDANLILGRLNAHRFLAGEHVLSVTAAEQAVGTIAAKLDCDLETAAAGIVRIANVNMAAAIRRISLDRGRDPRDFEMFSYGGGGPLHGVDIARELAIPRVIIPVMPGIFSALGMLLAELRQDFTRTFVGDLHRIGIEGLRSVFQEIAGEAEEWARAVADDSSERRFNYFADCRYKGQEFTIMVPIEDLESERCIELIREAFEAEYKVRYGHAFSQLNVEVVSVRSVEYIALPKPELSILADFARDADVSDATSRQVYFEGHGYVSTTVMSRTALSRDENYEGPLVVEEYGSTTIIGPGDRLCVDDLGQLVIDLFYPTASKWSIEALEAAR